MTGELVTALGEARRWNARITGLVAVAEKRGLARKQGYPTTTEWLMALSGEPAAACRSKVAVAEALEQMPETKKAFAAGDLSESRVKVLAQAQALAPEQFAQDETTLVAQVGGRPQQTGAHGAGHLETHHRPAGRRDGGGTTASAASPAPLQDLARHGAPQR